MNALSLRHKRGYTLTEIVLVVGILIALAALVFGLLGPIREKSRKMTCVSNLYQYRTAFTLYREDYGGMEPVQGARLSAAQMGLPPPSYMMDFWKQYGFWGTSAMFCPSFRHSERDSWGKERLLTSYSYSLLLDYVENVEPRYPLMTCLYHNPSVEFEQLPTWSPIQLIVFRLNGQIQSLNMTVEQWSKGKYKH